jgi:signal transduction histidine kinase/CheY-like chemotaxis protein
MRSFEEPTAATTPETLVMDGIRRTREIYRYLTPASLAPFPASHRRSLSKFFDAPNQTPSLIPYVQLAALRCETAKAIMTVIDRENMYFLAQVSKRTANGPRDMPMFETSEDSVLMGCSSVPVSGRVCELTIRLHADETCKFPMFVVSDMSKDTRFAELDVVASGPKYKFYCGTPIATRDGVNIGSLAVMDTEPRDGLTDDEERCLGETAAHIMAFLELNREAIEGRQARRMGYALNGFVSGKSSMGDELDRPAQSRRPSATVASYGLAHDKKEDQAPSPRSVRHHRKRPRYSSDNTAESTSSSGPVSDYDTSEVSTKTGDQPVAEIEELDSRSHSKTYARAANLIRESLELGDQGGVLFVGVTASPIIPTLLSNVKAGTEEDSTSTGEEFQPKKVAHAKLSELVSSPTFMKQSRCIPASTLASSMKASPMVEGNGLPGDGSMKLDSEVVNYFVGRYSGGRLWLLEEEECKSSSDETVQEAESQQGTKSSRIRRRAAELEFLRRAFPEARQLLMTPLWDAQVGRIGSVCFVWSSIQSRLFSTRHELTYLTSFCQTLMAECSRLDAMMADKQKSDFVGTISHELRSPLHGILASTEFLMDSNLTSFQGSLIHTIDACGKTLLDTINHVLDFSKINSFEKHWQASNNHEDKSRHKARSVQTEPLGGSALATTAPPLLQLFGATNISNVLEEVIEGITAGQNYNHSIDLTDTSKTARGRGPRSYSDTVRNVQASSKSDAVEVILDIDPGDWVFMTQPGAVRRIIMNIFGNAIKYTDHGSVKVRLELKGAIAGAQDQTMVLTVKDTGKGISPRFLKSRLFMPFAQENTLAPGTGLGLSICKSIITMLGGCIDVSSRVNTGTTVQVSLPLVRPTATSHSTGDIAHSRETSASSALSAQDTTIPEITNHPMKCRVAIYRSPDAETRPSMWEMSLALEKYITQWYHVQLVEINGGLTNIVILEEQDLQSFCNKYGHLLRKLALIILCNDASRRSQLLTSQLSSISLARVTEYLAKPCGPHKLAKVLRACLDQLEGPFAATPGSPPTPGLALGVTNGMNDLTLGGLGRRAQVVVQATEVLSASQTSQNAQHAITSPKLENPHTINDDDSFPFPSHVNSSTTNGPDTRRPPHAGLTAEHRSNSTREWIDVPEPNQVQAPSLLDLRMLIVDDNAINLKLLHTFLKRRQCSFVATAENGAVAVDMFTSASADQPYEVVFMDVSMPVMNGFEATRAIRDFEKQNKVKKPAMIIALTGLASGRDQAEGFASGCDIYLTKPVSFKEVGRLLDNWTANQRKDANGEVMPPVVGGGVSENGLQTDATQ